MIVLLITFVIKSLNYSKLDAAISLGTETGYDHDHFAIYNLNVFFTCFMNYKMNVIKNK